jgi:putative peptide zinc metalloprotease protein
MANPETADKATKVSLPAFLEKRLQAFRIGTGDRQTYVLRDRVRGKNYDFEPWQFFVLEVLPGCEDEPKLATVFQDRFGYSLPTADVQKLFASLADAGLIAEDAAGHPLLVPFTRKHYAVEGGQAKLKSFQAVATDVAKEGEHSPAAAPAPAVPKTAPANEKALAADASLPPGMQDAIDFDPRVAKWMWVMFNPRPLLAILAPLTAPLRFTVYALPLLVIAAVNLGVRNAFLVEQDLRVLVSGMGFVEHWLFSLLTVNLALTITTAIVAYRFRATVSGFGIALVLGFMPRFTTRIAHLDQLTRVERMWLHGAPLLLRMAMFSLALLTWYSVRAFDSVMARGALALAMLSALGFIVAANPLTKSGGYHLLAAFTNEPHLRGKAYKTLVNKLRGGTFKEADEVLLATYAIVTAGFMFALCIAAAVLLGTALSQIQLGGTAIILAVVVGLALVRRTIRYLGKVEAAYERSLQFERWRKRALPAETTEESTAVKKGGIYAYLWRALPLCGLAVLFLPYSYRAGGAFEVYPNLQQVITTDVSGIVRDVYFDGGEVVKKGTVVARLADEESRAQVAVYDAKIREQEAIIAELESGPRREQIALAQRELEVEQTRVLFSETEMARKQVLASEGLTSMEDLDQSRREHEVNMRQVEEQKAAVAVARMGVKPEEVAAAQAKIDSLKAERDVHVDRIRRTVLLMPFDGKLLTLHLKQKGNAYYERGTAFAAAESLGDVLAEIQVPESEMEFVAIGKKVAIKPMQYSAEVFTGVVTQVDWNVTERQMGNVVKVLAQIENADGRLKNGMTGFAKIEGATLPVWQAFSLTLFRFIDIHVWSWIP